MHPNVAGKNEDFSSSSLAHSQLELCHEGTLGVNSRGRLHTLDIPFTPPVSLGPR